MHVLFAKNKLLSFICVLKRTCYICNCALAVWHRKSACHLSKYCRPTSKDCTSCELLLKIIKGRQVFTCISNPPVTACTCSYTIRSSLNELNCVGWDVKLYSLTRDLKYDVKACILPYGLCLTGWPTTNLPIKRIQSY